MFSIRRILQRPNTCNVLPQLYNIRRAALTSHAAVQEPVVDMSPQTLSQTSKEAASPSYYKPLSKLDKFIPKEPTSKIVSIHNVPSTATKEDVLRLARLAFHDVDIPIQEILFLRSEGLLFSGRVLILFKNEGDAQHFRFANDRSVIGGNQLKLTRLDTSKLGTNDILQSFRKPEMYSKNGKSAAGRTVVLSGFPQRTNKMHVSKWLQSKGYYPEDDETNAILQVQTKQQALVSKFFVRFPSESDAWRAVRRFHNVTFRPSTFNNRYKIKATVAY